MYKIYNIKWYNPVSEIINDKEEKKMKEKI